MSDGVIGGWGCSSYYIGGVDHSVKKGTLSEIIVLRIDYFNEISVMHFIGQGVIQKFFWGGGSIIMAAG